MMTTRQNTYLQVRLRGQLVTHTPLRIGAGRSYDLIGDDLPVVKDVLGRPVIPGSSVKGALRAYAESFLRALAGIAPASSPALTCNPLVAPCIPQERINALKSQYQEHPQRLEQALHQETCWACRVFGAPWQASSVQIKDLSVPVTAWYEVYEQRDGVSINRDKHTAQAKKLYSFEAVPEHTLFDFELVANDLNAAELGLLLLALEGLTTERILLGGAQSRGLGCVRLDVDWEHVEEACAHNALAVWGNRAIGADTLSQDWPAPQRDARIIEFFTEIGLSEAHIFEWRQARASQQEG